MNKILIIGGCNWLGREMIEKLLSEKDTTKLICIDNLSSEYSSRHIASKYNYLDTFEYIYMDVNDVKKLNKLIDEKTIIIYNILSEPDSIKGLYIIKNICLKNGFKKFIYRTNDELLSNFKNICSELKHSIGIIYRGELIGNYDIYHKKDIIETIKYYEKIGNNVYINKNFEYYNMKDVISFIYFLIYMEIEKEEHIVITQPTQTYIE